jgi:hypothetical protein
MTTSPAHSTEYSPVTLASEGGTGSPPPLPRINLSTLGNIRLEASRVYRAMRSGLINTRDGSRLVYSLTSIGKMLEAEEASQQFRELTIVDVQQSSVLAGIDLNVLTGEQLDALEFAVKTIDSIKDGSALPLPAVVDPYTLAMRRKIDEIRNGTGMQKQ